MMPSRNAGGTSAKLCSLSAFSSFFLAALTAAWPLAADGLNIAERKGRTTLRFDHTRFRSASDVGKKELLGKFEKMKL
jgi:hypothetical protein